MIHARSDYNRIQDPALNDPSLLPLGGDPIGENEPVFLIRAKDAAAPKAVRAYAETVRALLAYSGLTKGPAWDRAQAIANAAEEHADLMEAWQRANRSKLPDMPEQAAE